jgi:ABC-type transport system substrate-binding protein
MGDYRIIQSIRHTGFFPIALALACLTLGGGLAVGIAAQTKKPPIEEEEPVKTAKPKKPVRVEEDETDTKQKADQNEAPGLPDLALEADQASQPTLRALYRDLAVPYDLVTWKNQHQTRVAPVSDYVGASPNPAASINLRFYDSKWHRAQMVQEPLKGIDRIDHYEEIALGRVERFLAAPPDSQKPLSPLEKTLAAEKVLAAVLRFHDAAVEDHQREGAPWTSLRDRLRESLLKIQMERLHTLVDSGDWKEAFALATRLARTYPEEKNQQQLAQSLGRMIEQSMRAKDYKEAQFRLQLLEGKFPNSTAIDQIRNGLRLRAEQLLAQAHEKEKLNDRDGAMSLVSTAESIWPALPGLQDYRLTLTNALPPTLEVGVRDLPEKMSPAEAATDSERQAVELMFESLVKMVEDERDGETYEPGLAQCCPRVVPMGRSFQLVRDAYWSDSDGKTGRVNAGDVWNTVQFMKKGGSPFYDPAWAELVEMLPVRDASQVTLRLHQGFLEPLSLMSFKILPPQAEALDFAERPIGSGPFKYQGREGEAAVFVANHNYNRAGKVGQPQIRKIRFFHSANPPEDFNAGRLHVLLDLPTELTRHLRDLANVDVLTLRNRRIFFLAANYLHPPLKNDHLRKALAHAINREQILNDVFRAHLKGVPDAPHRPLNGPYPPGSWAYKPGPALPADPYSPPLARALTDQYIPKRPTLHLKYPNDDDRVKRACEAIRSQVMESTGIELVLEPRSPHELRQEVEGHNYELAYYHFDYPSDVFWLWPLFDGAANYLGYSDGELESAFQKAMGRRDFKEIQELTHNIHQIFYAKMPFIPLWQLDTHIAIHKDVKYDQRRLNPLLVFTNVEQWKLERK